MGTLARIVRAPRRVAFLINNPYGSRSARHRRLVGHRPRDRAHAARRGLRADARLAAAGAGAGGGGGARRRCRRSRRRDAEDCARLVAEHRERSAGSTCSSTPPASASPGTVEDLPAKHFDLQVGVNLRGLFLVTQAAIPLLRESRGWIVNLASIAGTLPTPGLATYGATKAAVISLTRSLNEELDADGVRAVAICPGFVDTPMARVVRHRQRRDDPSRGLRRGRANGAAAVAARARAAGRDRTRRLEERGRAARAVRDGARRLSARAAPLRPVARPPARPAERAPRRPRRALGEARRLQLGPRVRRQQDAQARVPRCRRARAGLRHARLDRRRAVEPHAAGRSGRRASRLEVRARAGALGRVGRPGLRDGREHPALADHGRGRPALGRGVRHRVPAELGGRARLGRSGRRQAVCDPGRRVRSSARRARLRALGRRGGGSRSASSASSSTRSSSARSPARRRPG